MDSGWLAAVKINFSEFGENNFFRFSKKCRRNLSLVSSMGWNFRSKLLQKKTKGHVLNFPCHLFSQYAWKILVEKTCCFRIFCPPLSPNSSKINFSLQFFKIHFSAGKLYNVHIIRAVHCQLLSRIQRISGFWLVLSR